MARQCFYSFHYQPDCMRASQVRNIGAIEGNSPARDNDWEAITKGGDTAIESWIKKQMEGRTCTIVLVGENTANRKWINHEIVKSWNNGMGIVGIRIHGLKNFEQQISNAGANPFDYVSVGDKKLSSIVKCYNPSGQDSKEKYDWIATNIGAAVEEAIRLRKAYPA